MKITIFILALVAIMAYAAPKPDKIEEEVANRLYRQTPGRPVYHETNDDRYG